MYDLDSIFSLFPAFTEKQREQIASLEALYKDWNTKVNVISRKDIDQFYTRHVLHSLCIAYYFDLNGLQVLDVGTGGGFPGIPLAIAFPEAQFTLVDSIAKKLKVVDDVAHNIGLTNVETRHSRMEDLAQKFDVITGRAVKSLPQIHQWTKGLLCPKKQAKSLHGLLYLKGGDFEEELEQVPYKHMLIELHRQFKSDAFFETKKLVHLFP